MSAPASILFTLKAFRRILNFLLTLPMLGFLVIFALQFRPEAKWHTWPWVVELHKWTDPIIQQFDVWFEWPEAVRYFPLALAIVTWIVKSASDSYFRRAIRFLSKPAPAPPPPLRAPLAAPSQHPAAAPMLRTGSIDLGTIAPESEHEREELLRRYQEIEEALKSSRRKRCTFLSIDIVGSTKMKVGISETDVAVSFRAYEEMVKKIFKQYGAWKQAWTPDGVMVCFLQHELAVGSGQRILQSLEHFNTAYNKLRTPFRVRCGVHEGEVPIYEDTNLERVADRVIDIAGHMQKQGNPNALWVSSDVYNHLGDKAGFRALDNVVDGYKVFEWAVEPAAAADATFMGDVPPQPPSAPLPSTVSVPSLTMAKNRISRYEILEELGRGAMGAVYKARDPQIGRIVGIKVILTANLTPDEVQEYKQRFNREAQAAGQMAHPGIVTIHDIGEDETGQPYLVMEYVEGTPLDKLVAAPESSLSEEASSTPAGPAAILQLNDALGIAIQVAEALDYAHRRGVIHRDIKPANILITPEGKAKILDFGIAQLGGTQLTRAGQLIGTPAFMSPEQFTGGGVDARSDLFSLGTVLYWMLTGQNPFAADSLTAVAYKVAQQVPTPARKLNPSLPPDVETLLSRCLAKNPNDRYPTGQALVADLQAVKAGRPLSPNQPNQAG